MSNHGTASLVDGRYVEFLKAVVGSLPREISAELMEHWTNDQASLRRVLQTVLVPMEFLPHTDMNWLKVYRAMGMEGEYMEFVKANSEKLALPSDSDLWPIPVLRGVTPNKVVSAIRKLGIEVWTYTENLDEIVHTNERDSKNGSYVISCKKTIEADPENANRSADDIAKTGEKTLTLTEVLLLWCGYFATIGDKLDKKSVTLCSGSRRSDGNVPAVSWDTGHRGLYVNWYCTGDWYDHLRARAAVS